jgi:hypothetical protein
LLKGGTEMTDAPAIHRQRDAAIDCAFFGSHAGRTCYARARDSGWVLVVRQIVAQREPPVNLPCGAGLNGCRMTMRAAWHCKSVAPIRADAAREGCAIFRIALLAAAPVKALPIWRGTGRSNPSPSCGESANPRSLARDSGLAATLLRQARIA